MNLVLGSTPGVSVTTAGKPEKSLLRFLTCGSVDDGKSTLVGRLLFDSKLIFEDQLMALERDSRNYGTLGDDVDFAQRLASAGVLAFPMGGGEVRFVVHRLLDDNDIDAAVEATASVVQVIGNKEDGGDARSDL